MSGRTPAEGCRWSEHAVRARTLAGALGVTLLGGLLPGAGYLWTRRRLGYVVLVPFLAGLVALAVYARDLHRLLDLAFDPGRLRVAAVVVGAAFLLWAPIVVTTYLMARPLRLSRLKGGLGALVVCLLCVLVALPAVQVVRVATTQAHFVATVFEDERTATIPQGVTEADPWADRDRVNVLLLGGGGDRPHRHPYRHRDLLSMDTHTGRSVMFSLPRNLMDAQFPATSPLHDLYPDGLGGEGDPATGC